MVKKVRSSGNKVKQNKSLLKPINVEMPGLGKRTLPVQDVMIQAQRWLKTGQPGASINLLRQVTQQLPGFADAWMMLFTALHRVSDNEGLLQDTQRCLKAKPRFVPALTALATLKRDNQKHSEALQLIDKAIKLEPSLDELHNHRGVILKEMGRTTLALESFKRCLALNPANSNAIWNRSDMIGALSDEEYQRCLKLASDTRIDSNQRAKMYYALARSDEAASNYSVQFEHIQAGADLKRAASSYQHSAEVSQIQKTISAFPASTAPLAQEEAASANNDTSTPIFICGLPRSGTTLTEQILSSHPDVVAGDELNDLPLACAKWLARKGIKKSYPDWVAELPTEVWSSIGDAYLESTLALQNKRFFTDKNLQNYKAIGLIRKALPQARIIVCRRNPMDNLWGCYRQYFADGMLFTYNQEELADIWNASDKLIQHWQATGKDIFVMDYETLISNPSATIQSLLEFVGLSWNEACLNFHENTRSVSTLSATQVRKPLSSNRIEQWKRYEAQLQPMLKRLSVNP